MGTERELVRLSGELDVVNAAELRDRLEPVPVDRHLVLDLTDVSFIDSVALGVLVAVASAHRRAGTRVVLFCPSGPVVRVLTLTQLERVLPWTRVQEEVDALLVDPEESTDIR